MYIFCSTYHFLCTFRSFYCFLPDQVFGSTLGLLYQLDKTLVPLFVLQCIKSIEKNEENLKTDGLYRISGNAAVIQKIRFEVRYIF